MFHLICFQRDNNRYINYNTNYTRKCLKDTSKIVTNIMMTQTKSVIKKTCRPNSKARRDYITWSKCGNSANTDAYYCCNNYIFETQRVKEAENEKIRIPLMCW